jgi:hypothetical protein
MKLKPLFVFAMLCAGVGTALAQTFYVDGVKFRIDTDGKAVLEGRRSDTVLGDYGVPAVVSYNGKSYDVKEIDGGAFRECKSLTSVTIPVCIEKIGDSAFRYCENLVSVSIVGEGLKELKPFAFANTGLMAISLPESLEKIGNDVFYGCKSLTTVLLPTQLKEISLRMFYGCENLTSIYIPRSVVKIQDYAFAGCDLRNVDIPSDVTYMGWYVFKDNNNLTKVTSHIMEPYYIAYNVFDVYDTAKLYVPDGTFELYQKKESWKYFSNMQIIEDEASVSLHKAIYKEVTEKCSLDGKLLSAPQKGLNILRMSDSTTRKVIK